MSQYINCASLVSLLRNEVKNFYHDYPSHEIGPSGRHPYIESIMMSLIPQCNFQEISESIPFIDKLNTFLMYWDEEATDTKAQLKKKGRKKTNLDQITCFELREVLKKYNGHYMQDLIIILKAFKTSFPDLCEHLPYLSKEGLKKAIERGSKHSQQTKTRHTETATK